MIPRSTLFGTGPTTTMTDVLGDVAAESDPELDALLKEQAEFLAMGGKAGAAKAARVSRLGLLPGSSAVPRARQEPTRGFVERLPVLNPDVEPKAGAFFRMCMHIRISRFQSSTKFTPCSSWRIGACPCSARARQGVVSSCHRVIETGGRGELGQQRARSV